MVFFGQLREPELDSWSAPLLALRDEGQEQQIQQKLMKNDEENDELLLSVNMTVNMTDCHSQWQTDMGCLQMTVSVCTHYTNVITELINRISVVPLCTYTLSTISNA